MRRRRCEHDLGWHLEEGRVTCPVCGEPIESYLQQLAAEDAPARRPRHSAAQAATLHAVMIATSMRLRNEEV